jgi:2-oxoglutarate ferredoxin oxidoreductase subunit alpha
MSVTAFDLADRFQTPVFVASDLDIGMNDWMCKRLQWDDDHKWDRGKCLTADELESVKKFSRYLDAEGDGIAARSLPGVHGNGAYFVRGSGHDKHAAYTEDSDAYQEVVDRLARKLALAATKVPAPEIRTVPGAEVGIVSLGGCHAAVVEAIDQLRAAGIDADYMRIKAFPFDAPVRAFLDSHAVNFVVEQNRDAQLRSLLAIETGMPRDDMTPVLDYGGMPLTASVVVKAVMRHLHKTENVSRAAELTIARDARLISLPPAGVD